MARARASPESTVPHPIALLELTSLSSTQELKQMCGRCEECGGEGKDGAGVRAPHPHFRALPPHHLLSPLTTLVLWVVGAKLWLGGDGMGRSCTGRCGRARHPLAPSRQLATLASLLTPTTQCPSFSAFRCWLKPMQGAQRKLRKEGVVRGGSVSEAKVRTGWSPRVDARPLPKGPVYPFHVTPFARLHLTASQVRTKRRTWK